MKKIIVIPDSFKGSLQSREFCDIAAEEIGRVYPAAQVTAIPIADGGEGTVEAFLRALPGSRIAVRVKNPFMEEIESFYGLVDDGRTAVVEMAAAAGLSLAEGRLDPGRTTTYGVGQLMADAARRGARRILLGLGGSCTNDFGVGAAAACGVRFRRADGAEFLPVGGNLGEIAAIDCCDLLPQLRGVEIVAMCDIDNPLYGPQGAACVFAAQKGADAAQIAHLDRQLRRAAAVVQRGLGKDVARLPGAGAAGGMGGGLAAFFSARLQMGIETVLETVRFSRLLAGADLVISGEGSIDAQSLRGKAVVGIARRTKAAGVPLLAVVGAASDDAAEALHAAGVTAIFPINRRIVDWDAARSQAKRNLAVTLREIFLFLQVMRR